VYSNQPAFAVSHRFYAQLEAGGFLLALQLPIDRKSLLVVVGGYQPIGRLDGQGKRKKPATTA
jgi:hypothetical protein